jgi:hypothetical protein
MKNVSNKSHTQKAALQVRATTPTLPLNQQNKYSYMHAHSHQCTHTHNFYSAYFNYLGVH